MAKNIEKNVKNETFSEILSEKYLEYALSTIMSRSLPDVRDGLKPVHRRLLYAMSILKLDPSSSFKKCARIVGDVIGKFHPHGDVAIYETLVRLAQDFAVRYPLIDGQGNFGSIDGDGAAAMRYTESKLTKIATFLLKDLDKDVVDFKANYDASDHEPVILPALFPNLLANGSEGIAVGMATSIPPHNLDELCKAMQILIENPNAPMSQLLKHVKGPDFPTGGVIIEPPQNIAKIYETGRGSIKVRAKWHKEDLSHGLYQIIITEIPYQVQKSRLLEKLADLYQNKKLPMISNMRDESVDDLRIIIEPKNRTIEAEILMESLFKATELESRFNCNMNVLSNGNVPKVMNLKEILLEFLQHSLVLVKRKSTFLLARINGRIEVLNGLLVAHLNLDEIIRIIRFEDHPKQIMIEQFKLTDLQAEAILNMKLRSLRKLEEIAIKSELKDLEKEKLHHENILSNENVAWQEVSQHVVEIQENFGKKTKIGKRRTSFDDKIIDIDINEINNLIAKESITLVCSKLGWVRSFKGHAVKEEELKYREGDEADFIIKTSTADQIILVTNRGKFFTLKCENLAKAKKNGDQIRLMIDIEDNEKIIKMINYAAGEDSSKQVILAGAMGKGFIANLKDLLSQTKSGKQIVKVSENDELIICHEIDKGHNKVAVVGSNRKMLIFDLSELPEMKRGQGVKMQKYSNAKLTDLQSFNEQEGLSWLKKDGSLKVEKDLLSWIGKRAGVGRFLPRGFSQQNRFFDV